MPNQILDWLGSFLDEDNSWVKPGMEDYARKKKEEEYRKVNPFGTSGSRINELTDFIGGATGFSDIADMISGNEEPPSDTRKWGNIAGFLTDILPSAKGVLSAGLPFSEYIARKLIPKRGLIHPSIASDRLRKSSLTKGQMGRGVYASPNPEYAELLGKAGEAPHEMSIPIIPESKNVLDLINVDPQDFEKMINILPEHKRSQYVNFYNDLIREGKEPYEAMRLTAGALGSSAGEVSGAGFDAVRRGRVGAEEWMIPQSTPIHSSITKEPLNAAAGVDIDDTNPYRKRPPLARNPYMPPQFYTPEKLPAATVRRNVGQRKPKESPFGRLPGQTDAYPEGLPVVPEETPLTVIRADPSPSRAASVKLGTATPGPVTMFTETSEAAAQGVPTRKRKAKSGEPDVETKIDVTPTGKKVEPPRKTETRAPEKKAEPAKQPEPEYETKIDEKGNKVTIIPPRTPEPPRKKPESPKIDVAPAGPNILVDKPGAPRLVKKSAPKGSAAEAMERAIEAAKKKKEKK